MLYRVFIFILFSFVAAAISNRSYLCSPSVSSQEVFKCSQGSDCVNKENVCDGTTDCSDGSDEEYCFSRKRRQSGNCILPPYPVHGTYEVLNALNADQKSPGQSLDTFVLKVSCDHGYGMMETGSDVDAGSEQEVFCVSGKWSQSMPKCVRFCKLEADPSVRHLCSGLKTCKKLLPPGTLVKPVCNSPVYYSTVTLLYMKCIAGSWDYVAKCNPDCGRITPEGVQLLIDGTPAKRGELPWHAGIYRRTTNPYMQICGGSLVSNNVVISAAHCFWSDVKKLLPETYFAVAVGKLYRPWDDARDVDAQKSDVEHIAIPDLFRGAAANFQEDIAILTLTNPFIYDSYIRPVCIHFDPSFDRWHLQHENLGKVAGWGLTAANGPASEVLKVVDMPFVIEATCIKTLPSSFTAYITGDKFCAGYTNGTALCKGDSGGGIVFSDREQGLDRYYLRGIVSTAPTTNDKMCNDRAFTTFTRISKHEDLIQNSLAIAGAAISCSSLMFQCADGSCTDLEANCGQKFKYVNKVINDMPKPVSLPEASSSNIYFGDLEHTSEKKKHATAQSKCAEYSQRFQEWCRSAETITNQKYISGSREANRGEFPHMALLGYGTNSSSAEWLSGGSIISERFILTAAHAMTSPQVGEVSFATVGILKRTDPPEVKMIYNIKRRIPHPDYKAPSKYNDIALLETETEIKFNQNVLPICLDTGDTDEIRGMVTGWGNFERNGEQADNLKLILVSEKSEATCKSHYQVTRQLRNGFNHTIMMCYNAYENGSTSCQGDGGDPLQAINNKCLYTVVGVVSFGKGCGGGIPEVYTRVAPYVKWIESFVW